MKLIIDIPEVVKHKIYAYGLSLSPSDKEQLIRAIMNGIPLDTIKTKIELQMSCNGFFNDGIERALQIIDKYTVGEES